MSEKIARLDKSVIDMVYPVGAIYMSVNSTNPGNLFGGKWEQIKDRFMLACGDTYAAGSTGGEAEHTLTVDEMPTHDHKIRLFTGINGVATTVSDTQQGKPLSSKWNEDNTLSSDTNQEHNIDVTGGGSPHNNMPPYLAVYAWKRIA